QKPSIDEDTDDLQVIPPLNPELLISGAVETIAEEVSGASDITNEVDEDLDQEEE
ncbi:lytic transglycosylase F, partial [Vibrio alginolyticus]|nr:lytic transglycosylase F [Vibrio alginolyticus]MDW2233738.1 lytic transglycosylase F [Vibrio sp. 2091]